MKTMNATENLTQTDAETVETVNNLVGEIIHECRLTMPAASELRQGSIGSASHLYTQEALDNNLYIEATTEDWKPVLVTLEAMSLHPNPTAAQREQYISKLQSILFGLASGWMTRSAGVAGAGKGWGANRALAQLFTGAVAVSWGDPTCAPHSVNTMGSAFGGLADLDTMLNNGVISKMLSGADVLDADGVKALSTGDFVDRLANIPEYSNGVLVRDHANGRAVFGDRSEMQYRTMTRIEHTLLLVRWSYSVARALDYQVFDSQPFHEDSQAQTTILDGNGFLVLATHFDGTLNRKVKAQSKVVLDKMRQLKKQSPVSSALHSPFPFSFVGAYVTAGAGYACPRAVNSVILAMPSFIRGEEE